MQRLILATVFSAVSAFPATFLDAPKAYACAGNHLDKFQIGATIDQIIREMSGACPSLITLSAFPNGLAVCEERGKTIFKIGAGGRVTDIRRGPNAYGEWCMWPSN